MEFILLIVGFIFLIKGADFFVEGSASLARIMKIPALIIGLTIVAMGTSAPEASVSINAALAGNNDIAISNVIGSNIFNGMMVVGICAFMKKFTINKEIIKRDLPINLLISIVLFLMMIDKTITKVEGLILLLGIVIYISSMVYSALKNREEEEVKTKSLPMSIVSMIVGISAVIIGGDLVVDNATKIALLFGLSQNFIGLTIVAIGTSLPELVTSIVATKKGESGMALGNAIGSNIFNILFILGMSSAICPLNVVNESMLDVIFMGVCALFLLFFAKTKKEMDKKEGLFCIFLYIAYMIFLFLR